MTRRLIPIFIIMFFLFSTSITALATSPQDSISENKMKFQQLNDKIMETNLQVSDLNSQMSKLNSTIKKNNQDITESEKQIKAAEAQRDQLISEIDSSRKLLDRRIRAMYKVNHTGSYLSMLLSSTSLSDFLFRVEAIEKIISFDKKLLGELDTKKETLNKTLSDLDSKNQQLVQIKNSNAAALQQLDIKKSDLEVLIKQFDSQKQAAAQIIADNEEKLVAHSISVINSQNPAINDLRNALDTLKSLLPQLSTASVKKKVESNIADGNKKLTVLIANSTKTGDGSNNDTYKATYVMMATAYTGHSLTALGLKPVRDPAGLSTIAVDPDVIPLGTKVFIPGYGYAICADTGGAIIGNKIDIFLDTETECLDWGRRAVTLYVIAYPGEW